MQLDEFKTRIFSLSERIYPMVARMLGSGPLAKDAIQEIMLKLWKQRSKLINHPNPNAYVFLTAKNHCLDQIKRKQPKYLSEQYLPILKTDRETSDLEFKELVDIIQNILMQCPVKHHEVLILRDIDGLEFDEIAAVTELKTSHIRVILSRTRKYVQNELLEKYHYEYGQKK